LLHITPAERAALQLLADGRSIHEIADRLRIHENDVDARLKALFNRMGLSTRAEAIAVYCCRGSVILDRKDLSRAESRSGRRESQINDELRSEEVPGGLVISSGDSDMDPPSDTAL